MITFEDGNYNDVIKVRYYENGNMESAKEVSLRPMVLIYSISMYEDINSDEVKIAELATKSKAYVATDTFWLCDECLRKLKKLLEVKDEDRRSIH